MSKINNNTPGTLTISSGSSVGSAGLSGSSGNIIVNTGTTTTASGWGSTATIGNWYNSYNGSVVEFNDSQEDRIKELLKESIKDETFRRELKKLIDTYD